MKVPLDWDQESFCTQDGCFEPATHTVLVGMSVVDDIPIYEMLCCRHAQALRYVGALSSCLKLLEEEVTEAVRQARAAGLSWAVIARQIGKGAKGTKQKYKRRGIT